MITQQTTQFKLCTKDYMGFPGGLDGKESACTAGDLGLIPGLGRSSGVGNGNPLQYYCLGNPMDGGVCQATVHRVTKSWTQLSDFTFIFFHTYIHSFSDYFTI